MLNQNQIINLLEYHIGASKVHPRGENEVMACCPVHGEHNPSFSISVSKQIYHCFSCHSSGSIPWLLYQVDPLNYPNTKAAKNFLREEYGVDYEDDYADFSDLRYDAVRIDKTKNTEVLPRYKLAVFSSGKETYKYFFNRGFTKKTMVDFLVGRDLSKKAVTVPIFTFEKELIGFVGRYISPDIPANSRYINYNFQKGGTLFPLDHLESKNEIILVEGLFDALYMHQLGYSNTLAILGNSISFAQEKILRKLNDTFTLMFDNDRGGDYAIESAKKMLRGCLLKTVCYPKEKKDPMDCTPNEIFEMESNFSLAQMAGLVI